MAKKRTTKKKAAKKRTPANIGALTRKVNKAKKELSKNNSLLAKAKRKEELKRKIATAKSQLKKLK